MKYSLIRIYKLMIRGPLTQGAQTNPYDIRSYALARSYANKVVIFV